MIACLAAPDGLAPDVTEKVRRALGLLAGGPAAVAGASDHALLALNPAGRRTGWPPARRPDGTATLFHGWLDNRRELARMLGVGADDPALVYGAAVARWGDGADLHCIGDYAAIVLSDDGRRLRLSRSPWSAPPLHYLHNGRIAAAASVVRALHACGLPTRLSDRKLADNLAFNLTEDEGWYEGSHSVLPGTIVHLTPEAHEVRRFYDPLAPREPIRLTRPEDYVEAVDDLLMQAARAALDGARRPGTLLSGGLDSTNVAVRLLRALPDGATLPSYTFSPHPDWAGDALGRERADERPAVEAFAALHPRLRPRFTDNRDADFDTRMDAMFLAMGMAPVSLPNLAPLHSLYALAREDGCDRLLNAGHGNQSFSANGEWGFTEFLREGKWVELYRAIRDHPYRVTSIPRAFAALCLRPLLPPGLIQAWDRLLGRDADYETAPLVPLRGDITARYRVAERVEAAGALSAVNPRAGRHHTMTDWFGRGDMQAGDIYLAFEQVHGIATRDVTAYRPLLEFCHAIPTDIFLRHGERRWLARELGRGVLPESIRTNPRAFQPVADWHLRLSRRMPEFRAELAAAERDPVLAGIVDFPALRARLDAFPMTPDGTTAEYVRHAMCLTRAVMTARFVRHVTGRNSG